MLALVYERDKGRCWLCGKHVERERASVDHVVPVSWAPERLWDLSNVRLAHAACNRRRGSGPAVFTYHAVDW